MALSTFGLNTCRTRNLVQLIGRSHRTWAVFCDLGQVQIRHTRSLLAESPLSRFVSALELKNASAITAKTLNCVRIDGKNKTETSDHYVTRTISFRVKDTKLDTDRIVLSVCAVFSSAMSFFLGPEL